MIGGNSHNSNNKLMVIGMLNIVVYICGSVVINFPLVCYLSSFTNFIHDF